MSNNTKTNASTSRSQSPLMYRYYQQLKHRASTNFWARVSLYGLLPVLFYFVFFCIFSWPWIIHFNTHFFTDTGDGYQNVWNLWWVNHAVTQLHQSPWHTTLLHYPYGTSLLGQTLNPFNGFVAIALLKVFSLNQTYNVLVVFSFVFTGVFTFWLCRFITKRYIPSLIGGFLLTFSSYHFAHAIGHMQLVSLEWVPLFILLWWKFLVRPSYKLAVGAPFVLLLVVLCDYYYFLYSAAAAVMVLVYLWRTKQLAVTSFKAKRRLLLAFIVAGSVMILPLPLALLHENKTDPLLGAHDPRAFSADVFSTVIDGEFWHFSGLTKSYWHYIPEYSDPADISIYLGFATVIAVVIGFLHRKKYGHTITFWFVLGTIFFIFALGPNLMVRGDSISHIPLPYALLEKLVPEFKLSGVPVRMMVMAILAASVIVAITLSNLNLRNRKGQLLLLGFCALLYIDLWPGQLPNTVVQHPRYVDVLKQLPDGAVLDNAALTPSLQLYDQVITDKPMALGYISRTPTSVQNQDNQLVATVQSNQFSELCRKFDIRYVTTPPSRPLETTLPPIYKDKDALIYDLKKDPACT